MSSPLYTRDILRLAADTAGIVRLTLPHGHAAKRSATCGSRIDVDVCTDCAGRVVAFGYRLSACALGQAAATLVARHIAGQGSSDLVTARADLSEYLTGARADPGTWPGVDAFAAVRRYPARHAAVLLPFDAAIAAVEMATARISA